MPSIRRVLILLSLLAVGTVRPERAPDAPRPPLAAARAKVSTSSAAPKARKAPVAAPPIVAAGDGLILRDGPLSAVFGKQGIVFSTAKKVGGFVWNLVGARAVAPRPEGKTTARVHKLVGDRSRWSVDQPVYSRVVYDQVRPGLDLVVESRPKGLKYTLHAAAGGPTSIPIRYEGAREVKAVDGGAALEVVTDGGSFREDGLVCWQDGPAGRTPVSARFSAAGGDAYSIELSDVDPSRPVVIDPFITWSTYFGGNEMASTEDEALALAVDADGNTYVAGFSGYAEDFPTTPGAYQGNDPNLSSFISKFGPSGELVWSTLFGPGGVLGIAVDEAGQVAITGFAQEGFPVLHPDDVYDAQQEAFVAQLNGDGSTLLWSRLLGGSEINAGRSVAFDASGNVLVGGHTSSADFPAGAASLPYAGGDSDGFIAKFSPGGVELIWASLIGGGEQDAVEAVTTDPSGNVYVTGFVTGFDGAAGFPATPGAFQTSSGGGQDAFAALFLPAAGELEWATFLGGPGSDFGYGIKADASGSVFVSGTGDVAADPQPVGGFQNGRGAFVVKLNPAIPLPEWIVYLGGQSSTFGYGMTLGASGEVTLVGMTYSEDFPVVRAGQEIHAGDADAFVARISADGQSLVWSTFLGGSGKEFAYAIGLCPDDGVVIAGQTQSLDFPAFNGFSASLTGLCDAFVARVNPVAPPAPSDLAQLREDETPIEIGGQSTRVVFFSALLNGEEDARLEVELAVVGEPYAGSPTLDVEFLPAGSTAMVGIELPYGTAYRWRARQVTASVTSDWVSFGGNPEEDTDFVVEPGEPPPPPPPPSGLVQSREDGTPISLAGWAPGTVVLSAVVSGSEPAAVEIELRPIGEPFTGLPTTFGGLVPPGTVESHRYAGLINGVSYHWRARQVVGSTYSEWAAYGANAEGEADFTVDAEAPTARVDNPKGNDREFSTETVLREGIARDNVQVQIVRWKNRATEGTGTADGVDTWSAVVPLALGDNMIEVTAVDHVGLTATRTIRIRRLP